MGTSQVENCTSKLNSTNAFQVKSIGGEGGNVLGGEGEGGWGR